jgi:hypothetical protein
MNSTDLQSAKKSVLSTSGLWTNWEEVTEGGFNPGQISEAYMIGQAHGRAEVQRILSTTFENNINKAFGISEEKFDVLRRIFGVEPVAMRMRILGIASFETLFILSGNDYISENIETVYGFLMEEMSRINSEEFTWSFVVMPSVEGLNDDAISSDGFLLRYAHKAA